MLSELDLAALRAQRRRLTAEHARLCWLRRLVKARGDLEVARLTGVIGPDTGRGPLLSPAVHAAIALSERDHALPSSTLLTELADTERALGQAVDDMQLHLDQATAELMRRYRDDPSRCLTPLPAHPLLNEAAVS